ncbi:MAG: hypothetical protein JXA37_05010 [Chloroflexia bacterium]|nr:hypothetical protein [Chloroflexia bacterium]
MEIPPRAKQALLDLVEIRVRLQEPPKLKQTFDRLLISGYSPDQALAKLRDVWAEELWSRLCQRGNIGQGEFELLLDRLE